MKGMFSTKGETSSIRIMAFICVVTSSIISILAIILNRDLTGAGALVAGLLLPALGSKAYQAREELRAEETKHE
jgi:predicted membrane channel-forming protein YqfA (hemolysin III family)